MSTRVRKVTLWLRDVRRLLRQFVRTHTRMLGVVTAVALVCFTYMYYALVVPPDNFPVKTLVTIEEGASVQDIGLQLEAMSVVGSNKMFELLAVLRGDASKLKAGDYYFERPLMVGEVVGRLSAGVFGLTPIKVTVAEGATSYQIAEQLRKSFSRFDASAFLLLAKDREGYLFPDTYLFLPTATASQVLEAMETNFYERVRQLDDKLQDFGRPLEDVVVMASLLEKEARTFETRQKIAGILWNRIEIGMPLQVDAVFGYIHSTDTFHPTFDDLEVDSPYNTYENKGLPPGPIANPGLSSIEAAVTPVPSNNLFYLTGRDGNMYYGRTFDDHLRNRRLYLD